MINDNDDNKPKVVPLFPVKNGTVEGNAEGEAAEIVPCPECNNMLYHIIYMVEEEDCFIACQHCGSGIGMLAIFDDDEG